MCDSANWFLLVAEKGVWWSRERGAWKCMEGLQLFSVCVWTNRQWEVLLHGRLWEKQRYTNYMYIIIMVALYGMVACTMLHVSVTYICMFDLHLQDDNKVMLQFSLSFSHSLSLKVLFQSRVRSCSKASKRSKALELSFKLSWTC